MPDETTRLHGLRRCEPAAFAELFEAYSDRVFRLAARLLNDMHAAASPKAHRSTPSPTTRPGLR
jgi:hypothetical protein